MRIKKLHVLLVLLAIGVCAIPFRGRLFKPIAGGIQMVKGKKTVADRIAEYGAVVQNRLTPSFSQVGITYPPKKMTIIGLKEERMVQVWVSGPNAKPEV